MKNTTKETQEQVDKKFIEMADAFIAVANEQCDKGVVDHRLVNASLLYASARFSAFITASIAESKEDYEKATDKAVEFYSAEFNKMLEEHMKQYKIVFDKKPKAEYKY